MTSGLQRECVSNSGAGTCARAQGGVGKALPGAPALAPCTGVGVILEGRRCGRRKAGHGSGSAA